MLSLFWNYWVVWMNAQFILVVPQNLWALVWSCISYFSVWFSTCSYSRDRTGHPTARIPHKSDTVFVQWRTFPTQPVFLPYDVYIYRYNSKDDTPIHALYWIRDYLCIGKNVTIRIVWWFTHSINYVSNIHICQYTNNPQNNITT